MTIQIDDQAALVAAARAGDERAFRALVEPLRRELEVHCYRMLGSPQDAEDITQETLLRAWRALDRFERRASVRTWLYRIATNACLDEIERRPRRPEPVSPYPDERLEDIAGPITDPAARYAEREGLELALLTAIQELPGRQRAILILRDVLGWTSPEVAGLLDSTVAATNSALQRARATIDAALPAASPTTDVAADRDLLQRYIAAWERLDIDELTTLLREDATLTMPPQRVLEGLQEILAFLRESQCRRPGLRGHPTRANGKPAVLYWDVLEAEPHAVLVLDVLDGRIAAMHAYRDTTQLLLFAG